MRTSQQRQQHLAASNRPKKKENILDADHQIRAEASTNPSPFTHAGWRKINEQEQTMEPKRTPVLWASPVQEITSKNGKKERTTFPVYSSEMEPNQTPETERPPAPQRHRSSISRIATTIAGTAAESSARRPPQIAGSKKRRKRRARPPGVKKKR